ncbi:MAG TPA: hypothetical protein VFB75_11605 [Burkholderiales bacterium]|nr:hypothetical protein [Burkholderiales bacterium]
MKEESVIDPHDYKGFQIEVCTVATSAGGYVATVRLTPQSGEAASREFQLPLDEDFASEEQATREAIQYGADLIDGLLPWFNPQTLCDRPRA